MNTGLILNTLRSDRFTVESFAEIFGFPYDSAWNNLNVKINFSRDFPQFNNFWAGKGQSNRFTYDLLKSLVRANGYESFIPDAGKYIWGNTFWNSAHKYVELFLKSEYIKLDPQSGKILIILAANFFEALERDLFNRTENNSGSRRNIDLHFFPEYIEILSSALLDSEILVYSSQFLSDSYATAKPFSRLFPGVLVNYEKMLSQSDYGVNQFKYGIRQALLEIRAGKDGLAGLSLETLEAVYGSDSR